MKIGAILFENDFVAVYLQGDQASPWIETSRNSQFILQYVNMFCFHTDFQRDFERDEEFEVLKL